MRSGHRSFVRLVAVLFTLVSTLGEPFSAAVPALARRPGFVRVDSRDPHRLVLDDGSTFHPIGENRINIYDSAWNYGHMGVPDYIAYMARNGMNTLRVFVFSDCHAENQPDAHQPGCLEPNVGRFDETVAGHFDQIFRAAEEHGVFVILEAFAIGFTPGRRETWKSWNDNPYNVANGGPATTVDEFFTLPAAREAAKNRLRYLLKRYGSSPNLLAIDLLNEPEWDGPIAEDIWIPWAKEMAAMWHREDPFGHPVTAGPVGLAYNFGGDETSWYGDPANDIVQWHLYGPEFYEVHALARETTRRVRETWSYDKPVLCGEFAWGGEDQALYDHTHVGLWSLFMSGAGAIAHSAPPFQIDSDELMTPERARHFRVLADFIARVDWRQPLTPQPIPEQGIWLLERPDYRIVWLLGPQEGYGEPVSAATVNLRALPKGRYRVRWWDDTTGRPLSNQTLSVSGDTTVRVPVFSRHVAGIIDRINQGGSTTPANAIP